MRAIARHYSYIICCSHKMSFVYLIYLSTACVQLWIWKYEYETRPWGQNYCRCCFVLYGYIMHNVTGGLDLFRFVLCVFVLVFPSFFLCISVSYFIVSHRNLFHLFLMLTLFSLDISLYILYISLCTLYSIIFCSFLCVMCWFICRIWCVCNIYSRRFPSLLHGIIFHEVFQRQSSWKET